MNNLKNVIQEYLGKPTNFAMLLTGNWGTGKTFYFKNDIIPLIQSTECLNDASKKYKTAYVSLYGLKSVEDVELAVFMSLFPLLQTKGIKLSIGLGRSLIRGIMKSKGLGDFNDYVGEFNKEKKNWISTENLVICFDDLERRNKSLDLNEIIGFVNSLVENAGTKIILIANEGEIEHEKFITLKEKTVGITLEFEQESKEVLRQIIRSRYQSNVLYQKFLNKKFILTHDLLLKMDQNLRTLIFSLDNFLTIHSNIQNNILQVENEKVVEFYQSVLSDLFYFSVVISIEFKKGKISFKKRADIDKATYNWKDFQFTESYNQKKKIDPEKPLNYKDEFLDLYYHNRTSEFKFFDSIFEYITAGSTFNVGSLQNEIKLIYKLDQAEVSPAYKVLNQLVPSTIFNLTNSKYKNLTKKMISYAIEGQYNLHDYLTVFSFALRFDNILELDPNDLKNKFLKGIKNAYTSSVYIPDMDLHLTLRKDNNYFEHLSLLKIEIVKMNNVLQEEKEEAEGKKLFHWFKTDLQTFTACLHDHKLNCFGRPVLKNISGKEFAKEFKKKKLFEMNSAIQSFSYRYSHGIYALKEEVNFIQQLKVEFDPKGKNRQKKNLENFLFNNFYILLEETANKLSE
ncbi:MAG: P-loop NTPase fold protein [Crocinitomicaceae bacterium]